MKKNRMLAVVILALVLLAPVLTFGKAQPSLRILTNVTGGKDNQEMQLFAEKLGKATGMQITLDRPASDYDKVIIQKLQAGEKYDLVYLTQPFLPNLVEQGAVRDITEDVRKSKILSDPKVIPQSEWDTIKLDGKIYACFNKKELQRVVNINAVIASKAGINVTQINPSLDGYYQVLKKLKDYNDKEAKVSGFYPINTCLSKMFDLQPWFASEGLKGGVVIDSNRNKSVPWSSDAAAPVWDWLHKLYAEDLLDKDSLIDVTKDLRNKFQTGKTGLIVDWAAWTGLYNANAGAEYPNNFKSVPLPGTKSETGKYMLTRGDASLFAIPVNAPNPKGAIKVLEYFATQAGGELLTVGIEGYDYNKVVDNGVTKYSLTELGKKHACDHGATVPISSQFKHPVGYNPGFEGALQYLQYASIEASLPVTAKYQEVVAKHAVRIIKGDIGVKEGLANMRNELKQAGVID